MAGLTTQGRNMIFSNYFGSSSLAVPTKFHVILITNATIPNSTTKTVGELHRITAGNGYAQTGFPLSRNLTDFETFVADDASSKAYTRIKDVSWTASGGVIPNTGSNAYYAVLVASTNAVLTSRKVIAYWSLGGAKSIPMGSTLTLQDLEMQFNN